jgi:hypothetical protein
MTKNRLVLVGCGAKKKNKKTYSWDIYESDYFQKRMTLAMLSGTPAILSAKHGFLRVNERIEPYDEDMREKSKDEIESWADSVAEDIPASYEEIVILAGKKYRNPLQDILRECGYEVFSPFDDEDISGIGEQISWCKEASNLIENSESEENPFIKPKQVKTNEDELNNDRSVFDF